MSKNKKGPVIKKGLDEWMATYSDMVTLLFCFFVLLYASSTRDETRFQYIFQAFSTGGQYLNTVVGQQPETTKEGDGKTNSDIPPINISDSGNGSSLPTGTGDDPNSFSELFSALKAALETSDASEDVVSVDGNGEQIRLRISGDVMFGPDSYRLTEAGRNILKSISPTISAVQKYIGSVVVQGHTAKVNGISAVNDWDLSSLRASEVTKYLEFTKTIGTEKLKVEGLGPNVPLDDSDTSEARAKNRRVEIVLNRNKDLPQDTEIFKSIMEYDYNQSFESIDADGNVIDRDFLSPTDVVTGIANAIDDKYGNQTGQDVNTYQTPVGPDAGDDLLQIPDGEYVATDAAGLVITPADAASTDGAVTESAATAENTEDSD